MDVEFHKNSIPPSSPLFQYDVKVLHKPATEPNDWDSEERNSDQISEILNLTDDGEDEEFSNLLKRLRNDKPEKHEGYEMNFDEGHTDEELSI